MLLYINHFTQVIHATYPINAVFCLNFQVYATYLSIHELVLNLTKTFY